ncbi:MAG TPA: ABC transporter ATP-binding protein [Tepidisphaeraceae bacterium]|nr:ABC transporter ATP-binding protein [Tepidisphaeraceae bacterium]
MADILRVENLSKSYGPVEALRGITFTAGDGEILGLLGPNGAGKTSTIECIVGLRRPDQGSISICGLNALTEPKRVKQRIGVALQSIALQDKITSREALGLFGSFYERHLEPHDLIERFSLREKADFPFQSLSAGQRQRLALALAFVNQPDLLLLDEPTVGLDPQSRHDLHASIEQLRDDNRTILLATHDMAEAQQLCSRIAIINHGKLIALGSPDELIRQANLLSSVHFQISARAELRQIFALPEAREVEWQGDWGAFRTASPNVALIELAKLLEAQHLDLLDLQLRRPTLEDAFIKLTGGR